MNKVGIESGCSTSLDDMLINIESSLLTNNSVFESYGLSSGINLNIKKLFRTFMDLLIRDIVMDDIAFEYGNEGSGYFMRIEIKPISGDTYYNIMNSSDSARESNPISTNFKIYRLTLWHGNGSKTASKTIYVSHYYKYMIMDIANSGFVYTGTSGTKTYNDYIERLELLHPEFSYYDIKMILAKLLKCISLLSRSKNDMYIGGKNFLYIGTLHVSKFSRSLSYKNNMMLKFLFRMKKRKPVAEKYGYILLKGKDAEDVIRKTDEDTLKCSKRIIRLKKCVIYRDLEIAMLFNGEIILKVDLDEPMKIARVTEHDVFIKYFKVVLIRNKKRLNQLMKYNNEYEFLNYGKQKYNKHI